MAPAGVNVTVTDDGATYNKLRRPDDFLTSQVPPKPELEFAKRTVDQAGLEDGETQEPPKRFRRAKKSSTQNGSPKIFDPAQVRVYTASEDTGMHSMFPGMLDEAEQSDEETNAAIAYLRSVRSEASTIPKLLKAPQDRHGENPDRTMYEDGCGDHTVLFNEGTWIAKDPTPDESYSSYDYEEDLDPQEQYYENLLKRYDTMRHSLSVLKGSDSPGNAKAAVSGRLAKDIPNGPPQWLHMIEHEFPSPRLLARMTEFQTLRGLKYCAQSLDRSQKISKTKSCWVWALLAKAPEVGSLDYEKVGIIRDLGHKAGQFGMRLRRELAKASEKKYGHGGYDGADEEYEEGEGGDDAWEPNLPAETEEGELDGIAGVVKKEQTPSDNAARIVAPQKTTNPPQQIKQGQACISDAEMSISEDEGEVTDDPPADTANTTDDPTTLEEARARLLAQLGDRFVAPSKPTPKLFLSRADAERYRNAQANGASGKIGQHVPYTEGVAADSEAYSPPKKLDWNTMATLDMILTVVAERYGQKDLMRFREAWGEE
ncbi:hypothetical protein M011DRAFT_482987 [Sporormia fimetaria CBS 119925]|uniref:Uncharacterized protein n=1 Tax=Sporormia fimetaria CBS 119925 TaxID=1340428 RepID=A0A6A6VR52_9PLEO|nr:hypothetical protein M011DRAFT_482987 [Sporormia fimetaria CBS 119925]